MGLDTIKEISVWLSKHGILTLGIALALVVGVGISHLHLQQHDKDIAVLNAKTEAVTSDISELKGVVTEIRDLNRIMVEHTLNSK